MGRQERGRKREKVVDPQELNLWSLLLFLSCPLLLLLNLMTPREINFCTCSKCQRIKNNRDLLQMRWAAVREEWSGEDQRRSNMEGINYSICTTLRIICTEFLSPKNRRKNWQTAARVCGPWINKNAAPLATPLACWLDLKYGGEETLSHRLQNKIQINCELKEEQKVLSLSHPSSSSSSCSSSADTIMNRLTANNNCTAALNCNCPQKSRHLNATLTLSSSCASSAMPIE